MLLVCSVCCSMGISVLAEEANGGEGLVALYTFDDPSEPGYDSSGNNNHLIELEGSMVQVSDGIATFGYYDYLISPTNDDFTDHLTDFTFTVGAKPVSIPTEESWLPFYTGWQGKGGFALAMQNGYLTVPNSSNGDNGWAWSVFDVAGYFNYHQYTVTYDSETKMLSLYVDGVPCLFHGYSDPGLVLDNFEIASIDLPFTVGACADGLGWFGFSFIGEIDDIAVYNRAFTEEEVIEKYSDKYEETTGTYDIPDDLPEDETSETLSDDEDSTDSQGSDTTKVADTNPNDDDDSERGEKDITLVIVVVVVVVLAVLLIGLIFILNKKRRKN